MPYPNGQWPDSALATIPGGTAMGGNARIAKALLPGVVGLQAAYLQRWATPLRPTSANDGYRPYSAQERVFLQRYRQQTTGSGPYGDVRYWRGARWVRFTGASAAVPGTSNHGRARAIDFTGLGAYGGERWSWMMSNAPRFGFTNPAWARNPNRPTMLEPWHWEGTAVPVSNYLPYLNQHGIIVPDLTGPAPIEPELPHDWKHKMFVVKGMGSPANFLIAGGKKQYLDNATVRDEWLRICGQDRKYKLHPDGPEHPVGPLMVGQFWLDRVPLDQAQDTLDVAALAKAVGESVKVQVPEAQVDADLIADTVIDRIAAQMSR